MEMKKDIKIADDVINMIAGIAATSVDGVLSLGEGMTFKNIPFIGTKSLKKGITILRNDEDNEIIIKTIISLKNGSDVKKTCVNVQEKIKESIESMLDIKVREVVVKVAKINDV